MELPIDIAIIVPVNEKPLMDYDGAVLASVPFDFTEMVISWNFETRDGTRTRETITPTESSGDYDWINLGDGMYGIGIPASGGATANNDSFGTGWISGSAPGSIVPFRGDPISFVADAIIESLEAETSPLFTQIVRLQAALARSDAAAKTDLVAELNLINQNFGTAGGDFDNEIHSLEASQDDLTTVLQDLTAVAADVTGVGDALSGSDGIAAIVAEILVTTTKLDGMLYEQATDVWQFTVLALENAPISGLDLSEIDGAIAAQLDARGITEALGVGRAFGYELGAGGLDLSEGAKIGVVSR
jgi:hypothetical protein